MEPLSLIPNRRGEEAKKDKSRQLRLVATDAHIFNN